MSNKKMLPSAAITLGQLQQPPQVQLQQQQVRQVAEGLSQSLSVVIEDAAYMEAAKQYIRTRHNNIRCFPKCGKVHKTKSFCGTPLTVSLHLANGSIQPFVHSLVVFGEFRNVRKPLSFSLLAPCLQKQRELSAYVAGQLTEANGHMEYAINPPRKWRYRARIAQVLDMHVFTVYVVYKDVIVAVKDSPQFQVIPIWKADEGMLRFNEGAEDEEEDDEIEIEEEEATAPVDPPPAAEGAQLARQDSFIKRMKQPQQAFTGYQLHNDGSSSLNINGTDRSKQNVNQVDGVAPTGGMVGLPFFSTQSMSNLRLGNLPPDALPHYQQPLPAGNNPQPRVVPPPPGFPPLPAAPAHAVAPTSPSATSINNNGNNGNGNGNGHATDPYSHHFGPGQFLPNPMMLPPSSSTGAPPPGFNPAPFSFFPSPSTTASAAAGMMHMGPEAFGHMQMNNMGAFGAMHADYAPAMHQASAPPMVTATSVSSSSQSHPESSTAPLAMRENRFLNSLLSNAYVTGQAINHVVSQQSTAHNQQQHQYYNGLGMAPPTAASMAAAFNPPGGAAGGVNGGAQGFHPNPGSTATGFSSAFPSVQQPHAAFSYPASSPSQQPHVIANGGNGVGVAVSSAPSPVQRPGIGLSNSKNIKDKHQD